MAFRRTDWPLSLKQLLTVISHGETRLVEFKRQWPALGDNDGKAKVAKEVIALANAVGQEELALLIFGIDDERKGGKIFPVESPPEPEALSQILADYAHPAIKLECRHYKHPEGTISVVAVLFSPTRPHYCIREASGVLTTRDVYVRRDKQVGVLQLPELEAMIREKPGFSYAPEDPKPVEFGFVSVPHLRSNPFALQVRNLTTEPLTDVRVTVDFRSMRDPSICCRVRPLNNFTVPPGETREVSVSASSLQLYKPYWRLENPPEVQTSAWARSTTKYVQYLEYLRDHNSVGDGWLDVEATLYFRGFDGLISEQRATLKVDIG